MIEDAAFLTWDKPVNSTGQTPPGLAGYYIYCNGEQIKYIGDPDTLFYYDFPCSRGEYPEPENYTVTANYDMTAYGNPGVFQQSSPVGPVVFNFSCYIITPFIEPWNQGNFAFNNWHFDPSQSNWIVETSSGNPAPTAAFTGLPQSIDYENLLISTWLDGLHWLCGHMYVEFDYKLEDINGGNTEKLSVEYRADSLWTEKMVFSNNGTAEWIHVKADISEVNGYYFQIGFKASGSNSANISAWMVDNINVYFVCEDPINTHAVLDQNTVTLTWEPSCDSVPAFGYNIWRTDGTGYPPFHKINPDLVNTAEYHDVFLPGTPPGTFRYYVTALYESSYNPGYPICESTGGDTVQVDYRLGTGADKEKSFSVSPNPASKFVSVNSSIPVESYELYDQLGRSINVQNISNEKSFIIPLAGADGFCYIRFRFADGSVKAEKIIIR